MICPTCGAPEWAQYSGDGTATVEERAEARVAYGSDDLNIDEDALASRADDGVWVQAWVWLAHEKATYVE